MDKHLHSASWDADGWVETTRPGYRLKKLEVINWGTFDSSQGQVYSLALDGRTTLLVGQNGSGKSTLVDALLTLLVQPGVRNYNVAAGAKKRERDERTYIRGACGRSSDDQLGSVTDYLRPHDKHYSVLLACFQREDNGSAFTIVQVLQVTEDGEVDKTYAFCEQERGIATDLAGLTRSEKIRKQLLERGFRATSKYSEYLAWISRATNMRPKAMDVFNQTVAVKDIQSLNRFIRDHMLEAHPWRERIDGLLAHFAQLSQAHQSLVKARRQVELLLPIERAAQALRLLASEIEACQNQLDAVDSFFREKTIAWLQPRLSQHQSSLAKIKRTKLQLQDEMEALDETQRFFKNEIEKTGGDRLRQLPLLLETQHAILSAKRRERSRLEAALASVGIQHAVDSREAFADMPAAVETARLQLTEESSRIAELRLQHSRDLADIRTSLDEEQARLDVLSGQPGNLPFWLADLRSAMAKELQLPASELSFACELLSVAETELAWQPAIEMVLRRFALSLLVSERHYRAVSNYVEHHVLRDARGRGQRLVYVRVPETFNASSLSRPHSESLVRKLTIQREHPLSAWLSYELQRRFDYRCCETLEQFQRAPGLAITKERHVKLGPQQHEKDDRPQSTDSKHFVLGWDNARQLNQLREGLAELRRREKQLLNSIQELEASSKQISKKLAAVEAALSVPDFDLIDTDRHLREVQALETERQAIEDSNDSVRVLRERLDAAVERRFAAQRQRDEQVAAESNMLRESEQGMYLIERHQGVLLEREQDGSLEHHRMAYTAIEAASGAAACDDLARFSEQQMHVSRSLQQRLSQLNQQAEPLRSDVVRVMQKFLSENPEERNDLRSDLAYMDGFLGLLEQLRREDLPRHEHRFRERLNEKVLQEIGVFHAALQCERQEILGKIQTLNDSLEQLEYQAGTTMRLEPRAVHDREIRDFQTLLRDCLSEKFDGDAPADEARFARIERLIRRLREEERWRDKVIDVRRWFDFSAREIDALTGEERSCYEDSSGQSGGEKAKLAFTILVAAIAYQFDIDPTQPQQDRLRFVVVDEMFSKVDDRYADYALQLFEKFGLQLLIVAPLDAKARVTEPYVGCYLHTVKNEKTKTSDVISLTADDYASAFARGRSTPPVKPR